MYLLEERSNMLLATYQPKEARSEHQNHQYDCFCDRLSGEYPVFCFPARTADEFRFRSLLAAPCKPECLIFFDTDDYVRFDAVTWNNILTYRVIRISMGSSQPCSMTWMSAFPNTWCPKAA